VPTPRGLAEALLLPPPRGGAEQGLALFAAARTLLAELAASPREEAIPIAQTLLAARWPWASLVLTALGASTQPSATEQGFGLRVWQRLREWEDLAPPPPPEQWPVEAVEARARLVQLLAPYAEPRPPQMDYASAAAAAFSPRERAGEPHLVLLEGGTGIGKTLGYLAPATVWAAKNKGTVWISTYTRNLQRQLDRELDSAYRDREAKARRVVVRKGRENLICLLNYEEALVTASLNADTLLALGLVARWLLATRDGDMIGGDFPAWLADLLGRPGTTALTDTRGECIYSACRHYRRCFIERSIRRARRAEIVVANHALTLVQAARAGEDAVPPTRMIFDEAHHLFDAADAAFSLQLSGLEARELRRWICGAELARVSRRRGLAERVGDLLNEDPAGRDAVRQAVRLAARCLPGSGWQDRLSEGQPLGETEAFLALVRQQVYARAADADGTHPLEVDLRPPVAGLAEAAAALRDVLARLIQPLRTVALHLDALMDAAAGHLDTAARARIEGLIRGLNRRAIEPLTGWCAMLQAVSSDTPPHLADWLGIDRHQGRERDVGLHRHWIDPTRPLAETVLAPAHGVLLTSATLRDSSGDEAADWRSAAAATGVCHLTVPLQQTAIASPFDYAAATRIVVTTDVDRNDPRQVAAAYRELFLASGGGALGLFTAISRLKLVYQAIAAPLEAAGLSVLAQHVDALDVGTLIDIFRAEEDACLLGTDAVRDGIDVPGRALRLIVFDRVPWPRPDLLHRARRAAFGGRAYEEFVTRRRLKQAYGRLIRKADDRGVFVMLDRALPSRLTGAFPADVPVIRCGLAGAVALVRDLAGAAERPA
jgi:ATP-dependent DNA helicase DinG